MKKIILSLCAIVVFTFYFAQRVGADEYMTKPFSPTNILRKVKEIFKV